MNWGEFSVQKKDISAMRNQVEEVSDLQLSVAKNLEVGLDLVRSMTENAAQLDAEMKSSLALQVDYQILVIVSAR